MPSQDRPPSYVQGRRGGVSITDAIVAALWRSDGAWPKHSLADLRTILSAKLGYDVASSTVRSSVYNRPDLFERAERSNSLVYQLTSKARKRVEARVESSGTRP